jgi:phenylacetate-CoA ligase
MVTAVACVEDLVAERLTFLRESETWSRDRLQAYQLQELNKLLKHVNQNVPYYQRLFARIGFDPARVTTLDDLGKLPLLTKTMLKENHADCVAQNTNPAEITYMTTGGSTGDPLKIMMNRDFQSLNHANTQYYMGIAGYTPGTRRSIRLHGNTLSQALIDKGQYWILDGQRLTMSVYHLTEATARMYVEQVNAHQPVYIHAFASALALFCTYIEKLGLKVTAPMECVFCDSETLYPWQRDLIKKVLNCRVDNIYGHTEGATIAISCPHSDLLHSLPQVGIMELLKEDGTAVTKAGELGEIVVTGFNNYVFPLIRYRTFDIGTWSAVPCPCGRNYPLLQEVQGRIQDFVINKDGRPVTIAPALFDYQFDWSNVDRFQIYQDTKGRLTFKLVVPAGYADFEGMRCRVIEGFKRILNREFQISVEFVDTIPHTIRGKYRYIDQRIPSA